MSLFSTSMSANPFLKICNFFQGFDCSSIKAVRELGSELRETVRSLSSVGVRDLMEADLSTRGPGWTGLW